MDIVVSKLLPIHPSPGEVGRRIVRHGLARVLAWWGEEPGPAPDAQTHAIAGIDPAAPVGGVLFVSPEMHEQLQRKAAVGDLNHPDRDRRRAAERAWLAEHREHRRTAQEGA